jgi:two-component system OmpR family response regulator
LRILLVEDDVDLADAVCSYLRAKAFVVDVVGRLDAARSALLTAQYSAVLLDLHLEDGDGLELMPAVRALREQPAVIILTARDQVSDRIRGLDAGADDYLTKPYDPGELLARLRAVQRRSGGGESVVQLGSLQIDLANDMVRRDGVPVVLTQKEWALLRVMAMRPERIHTREALQDALYGYEDEADSNTLEVVRQPAPAQARPRAHPDPARPRLPARLLRRAVVTLLGRPRRLADRLARTLMLWVGGVWLLCVVGATWYVDGEINHNFDSEMIESAHRMVDIAVHDLDRASASGALAAERLPLLASEPIIDDDPVIFQLVDAGPRMLMRSREAPRAPFAVPLGTGFAETGPWRVYTVSHPSRPLWLHLADPLAERHAARNGALLGLFIPLVAVLPLLALMLRRIARRELRVVQQLETEIGRRSGSDLSRIALDPCRPSCSRWASTSTGCSAGSSAPSTPSARSPPTPRTSCARRSPRCACACRPRSTRTCRAPTCSRRSTRSPPSAIAPTSCCSSRAPSRRTRSRASRSTWCRSRRPSPRSSGARSRRGGGSTWRSPRTASSRRAATSTRSRSRCATWSRTRCATAARRGSRSRSSRRARWSCRDDGPGVPAATLETLRHRHVRHTADAARLRLGLSIVGTIVDKHGGTLELSSPPPGRATASRRA